MLTQAASRAATMPLASVSAAPPRGTVTSTTRARLAIGLIVADRSKLGLLSPPPRPKGPSSGSARPAMIPSMSSSRALAAALVLCAAAARGGVVEAPLAAPAGYSAVMAGLDAYRPQAAAAFLASPATQSWL